jgi:hypothetical protein
MIYSVLQYYLIQLRMLTYSPSESSHFFLFDRGKGPFDCLVSQLLGDELVLELALFADPAQLSLVFLLPRFLVG